MYAHITLFQSHPTQRGNGRARGGRCKLLARLAWWAAISNWGEHLGRKSIDQAFVLEKCKRTMFQEKSAMLIEEDRAWEQSPRVPGTQAPGWDTAQCSTATCTTSSFLLCQLGFVQKTAQRQNLHAIFLIRTAIVLWDR